MIKNEKQYRITKSQADKFAETLVAFEKNSDSALHPLLQKAQKDAIQSQYEELREQVEMYESLRAGTHRVFFVESFDELPQVLIKARIAGGLSQKELAERLGLKEQQIQRYEAMDYATASLTRLKEVVKALGVSIREEVFLNGTQPAPTRTAFFKALQQAGLDKEFVLQRLLPPTVTAVLESDDEIEDGILTNLLHQAAAAIARVFRCSTSDVFNPESLYLSMSSLGNVRFKKTEKANERRLNAYTVYAHLLALNVSEITASMPRKPISTDAVQVRKEIFSLYGSLTFETALKYVWSHGIAVLPLDDAGAFHGACWRIEGRNVIVLKQKNKSASRWLFDLMHEFRHAGQEPEKDQLDIIESDDMDKERAESDEEVEASEFAGDVLLDGRAEAIVQKCVTASGGRIPLMKSVVPKVAALERVEVDALANYLAFRLSRQKQNWWGAAENLQSKGKSPYEIARNIFFEQVDVNRLSEFHRDLLMRALS